MSVQSFGIEAVLIHVIKHPYVSSLGQVKVEVPRYFTVQNLHLWIDSILETSIRFGVVFAYWVWLNIQKY